MRARTIIEIPAEVQDRLLADLRRGGFREIGGILMGECLAPGCFRVVDFTVDHKEGAVALFVRSLRAALQALGRFFDSTKHDYQRYNYLGEWHSHPSFAPIPSSRDLESAQSIVNDPEVGATFVTLLIVKLGRETAIEASGTIFLPNASPEAASLVFERRTDLV